MVQAFDRSILAALAAVAMAAALSSCAPGAVIDKLPGDLGLPAEAPARPTTPYVYPAVHDMPPPRETPTMSEEQQVKLEKDLEAVRDRQEAREGAAKKTAKPVKKKPAAADTGQGGGAQDGTKTNP